MTFLKELEIKKQLIEEYMKNDLANEDFSYKTVILAMKYSLQAGGKRIRPILMMSVYELFGKDSNEILPFASAIEYIHTYSLVHDDLPAMDNDDLRRGMPTCHKKYSEAMAILAGDSLLNYAFEKMLDCENENTLCAAKYLVNASGKSGMIGGQVIDIENENKKIPLELLNELHALKTGALIRAACAVGAILGGGSKEEIEAFAKLGSLIGLAFQIRDDVLDKISDEETLGKPIGSDEKNNKTTYLSYYSVSECEEIIKKLTVEAELILEKYGEKAEFLNTLVNYLSSRNK